MRRPKVGLGLILVLSIIGAEVAAGLYLRQIAQAPATTEPPAPARSSGPQMARAATRPRGVGKSYRPAFLKVGLSINDPRAFPGYTLLASLTSPKTYLIDMQGRVVHQWMSAGPPALGALLIADGHLLRPTPGESHPMAGPGAGGRVQEFTWDGKLAWDLRFHDARRLPHHDLARLPNGNVLMIAWEEKTAEEVLAAGRRNPNDEPLRPDCLLEIKPTGPTQGAIVWEWHIWDHLIQDHDPSKANFGKVADHPERIDVNFGEAPIGHMMAQPDGVAKLRSIGYLGTATGAPPRQLSPDWTHVNAAAYNAELDQIMLTVHAFSEIWIIDHSTTTAEAAGHAGGRGGKGGDLLYRWGNPRAHRGGDLADQRLFFPHNGGWIAPGLPGAGHALIFNNGSRRSGGPFSSVDEVALPVDDRGRYARASAPSASAPEPLWSYTAPNRIEFFAMLLSGAQRLPNGNTLICSGMSGTLFEVTPEKEIVWQYRCPVRRETDPGTGTGTGGITDFGPPDGSSLFRALRYGRDDPILAGKDLTPGPTIEELRSAKPAE
jgi:hypothetical protein